MKQEINSPVCVFCGSDNAGSLDHWIPKARGGSDKDLSNCVNACLRCNHRKNKRTGEEFIEWLISKGELVP
jgi:5-methylcytosine-specific restriction endonuclease McrA